MSNNPKLGDGLTRHQKALVNQYVDRLSLCTVAIDSIAGPEMAHYALSVVLAEAVKVLGLDYAAIQNTTKLIMDGIDALSAGGAAPQSLAAMRSNVQFQAIMDEVQLSCMVYKERQVDISDLVMPAPTDFEA